MSRNIEFPKDFLWGTSTAAHQIEGNNKNTDWWEWENRPNKDHWPLEPSMEACDSYNRYEEDFDLCVKLNNNAVRFSIEWARIEPSKGNFDQSEIEHYKKVLKAAKDRGLKTFVTLWHFTTPLWVSKNGGWTNFQTANHFSEYAAKCAKEFGDLIDMYATINEPQVYSMMSYLGGTWPPQRKNIFASLISQFVFIRAHNLAYKKIKENCELPVGIVKHIAWYQTRKGFRLLKPLDFVIAKLLYYLNEAFFLNFLKIDFIGVNHYFTNEIKDCWRKNTNDITTDLGWWVNPPGLFHILVSLKKYNLPIYVTENGLADKDDKLRTKFIKDMLIECDKAVQQGVNLKGYFYWSLIDNYEWHQGFWPRFGLVNIDRENNLQRIPRKSFYDYGAICQSNGFTID